MALSKDWREFLELLNSRGVDYVIVAAQSLASHPGSVGTPHLRTWTFSSGPLQTTGGYFSRF
jgi:hypothetical protein